MNGFVDLHAHFLPGIDDGAPDLVAALAMVKGIHSLGFEHLHATPHQRAGMYMPTAAQIGDAFAQVQAALPAGTVVVGTAAENFWDDVFAERLGQRSVPGYPGGLAFLFEVDPRLMPPNLERTLFDIRVSGLLPVMAHPERYLAFQTDLARAEAVGRSAALMVDLAALEGAHGRAQMKTARRLVEEGLAHAVATDVHAPDDCADVSRGMAWVTKRLGAAALSRLLADHPRRILAGDLPT